MKIDHEMKLEMPSFTLFVLKRMCFVYFLCQIVAGVTIPPRTEKETEIVSRAEWNASDPTEINKMIYPVPYVVIHHSYIPPACNTSETCVEAMLAMQKFHQIDRGWFDIGYSFAVGGDGRAYMGRGWDRIGAHAPGYNDKSIGICVIGDWRTELPPPRQLQKVKELINFGIDKGYITHDYILLGHRQTRPTECPGEKLYQEIKTWEHYLPYPEKVEVNTVPTR